MSYGGGMDASKLRTWRNDHALSQEALARYLGVTLATVNRWERGITPAPWEMLDLALPELHRRLEEQRAG